MDNQGLFHFVVLKFFSILKEFLVLYLLILAGEWFASKKKYNLFERAWLVAIIALSLFTFVFWANFGRAFGWF